MHNYTWYRTFIFCSIISVIISACTTLPSSIAAKNETIARPKRQAELNQIKQFKITGALAVKENNKGFNASLKWQQSSPRYFNIRLFGPFGASGVILDSKGNQVTLKDNKKTLHAKNAEQLLFQQTGHHVPFSKMYYWIRGLSAKGSTAAKSLDRYNHLTRLSQAGWTIHYQRYTSNKNIDLPSKMTIFGHGVKIKLIVKKWQI